MKKIILTLVATALLIVSIPTAAYAAPTEGWYNGHYCYFNGEKYYYVGNDGCTYICDPQPNQGDLKSSYSTCNGNCNGNCNNWSNVPRYDNNYNNNGYANYNYYNGILDIYDKSTEDQATVLARIMNIYAHGVSSQTTQAAVGWAVMNSVDASGKDANVYTVAGNFGYDNNNNVTDDFGRSLLPLARDIIFRWKAGRAGIANNGKILPGGYYYVTSTGSALSVTTGPNNTGTTWNFSYTTPYGS